MKVAMLTSVGDRCGIAAYTASLVRALEEFAEVDVVPILVGKQELPHYVEQAERLNSADVVHVQHEHSFWGGILPGKSAFWNMRYLIKQPLVVTAHTTTSLADLLKVKSEKRLPHLIAKKLLLMRKGYRDSVETAPFITGRTIVHTKAAALELADRGANPAHLHVIPAGIPLPEFPDETGDDFRTKHKLNGKFVVSLFGFIAVNKGYELLFKSLKRLPENVVAVIAGGPRTPEDDTYVKGLEEAIAELGLKDRVIITGYLPDRDVAGIMAVSDGVIAPHLYATGSYSITVPVGYGKAVIASDMACFTEMRNLGANISIFHSNDAEALAKSVLLLMDNTQLRKTMEANNHNFAQSHSWRVAAKATMLVYAESILDVERLGHHKVVGGHQS